MDNRLLCLMYAGSRLGANGGEEIYNGRHRASSTYADSDCRPATAAVVIATSDGTEYHDDDGRTVLTSHAPGAVVMATNCFCRYDDNNGVVDDDVCVLPARLAPSRRASSTLKAKHGHAAPDCHTGQLLRPS